MEKKYKVGNITCQACVSLIERKVSSLQGIVKADVFAMESILKIETKQDFSEEKLFALVEKLGYTIEVLDKKEAASSSNPDFAQKEYQNLLVQLIFGVPLFYIGMGHMLGFYLPSFFHRPQNAFWVAILQGILAVILMFLNRRVYRMGFKSLFQKVPTMETLLAVSTMSSFIYSSFILWKIYLNYHHKDYLTASTLMMDLYFESTGTILILIKLGRYLESKAKQSTNQALAELRKIKTDTAWRIGPYGVQEVPIEKIMIGDAIEVKAGMSIPLDGKIRSGYGIVNEAILTGESLAKEKTVGDSVFASTTNEQGNFIMEVTKLGKDTLFAKMLKLVEEASLTKAPIETLANRISYFFVPVVLFLASITFLLWLLVGYPISIAIKPALAVLVISCPCALGLATPITVRVANLVSTKQGILLKSASIFEETRKVDLVFFDKTGTLTEGVAQITDYYSVETSTFINLLQPSDEVCNYLKLMSEIERKSFHPLAKAFFKWEAEQKFTNDFSEKYQKFLEKENLTDLASFKFSLLAGQGIVVEKEEKSLWLGNIRLLNKYIKQTDQKINQLLKIIETKAQDGHTCLIFGINDQVKSVVAVKDTIKDDAIKSLYMLKAQGIKVGLLTGDNKLVAASFQQSFPFDIIESELFPEDKGKIIKKYQEKGYKVAMVGDGINDALALTLADIGIAMGEGTEVAMQTADIVILQNELKKVPMSLVLGRRTLKIIKQNLFWAFFYNILLIPVAMGVFYPAFGLLLNPMLAALAMSLSSLIVIFNALRLNNFKNWYEKTEIKTSQVQINGTINKIQSKNKGETAMKKVLKIENMSCIHCEKRIKGLLTQAEVKNIEIDLGQKLVAAEFASEQQFHKSLELLAEEEYPAVILD